MKSDNRLKTLESENIALRITLADLGSENSLLIRSAKLNEDYIAALRNELARWKRAHRCSKQVRRILAEKSQVRAKKMQSKLNALMAQLKAEGVDLEGLLPEPCKD